jgi:hypothetical protein
MGGAQILWRPELKVAITLVIFGIASIKVFGTLAFL